MNLCCAQTVKKQRFNAIFKEKRKKENKQPFQCQQTGRLESVSEWIEWKSVEKIVEALAQSLETVLK